MNKRILMMIPLLILYQSAISMPLFSAVNDTQYAFIPVKDVTPDTLSKPRAIGLDIMLGNSGFGLGGFYKHEINQDLSWTFSISVSEAKASNEVDYINRSTGETYTPNKVNRIFVVPAIIGLQYRLFRNSLTDSFRPYVFAGAGPDLIYSTPYDREFFNSFVYGKSHYGFGAYIGAGAYFGLDPSSLVGVSVRYYVLPLKHGIESLQNEPMANFNTFFITFNIATQY
ncbi:MAG: hypothetical protein ACP5US_02030 [Candidatus Kryptoniota bacterium]